MASLVKIWSSGSHFELLAAPELSKKRIIQIYPKKVYVNSANYAVFLCEVQDDEREEKSNGN